MWVRIDDQAPRHDKMLKAGPAACWLWVCGLAHCQSQLTDGYISKQALSTIGIPAGDVEALAGRLVKAGLFERVKGNGTGGYKVHDYLSYNISRKLVLEKRAEDAARKRAGEQRGRGKKR